VKIKKSCRVVESCPVCLDLSKEIFSKVDINIIIGLARHAEVRVENLYSVGLIKDHVKSVLRIRSAQAYIPMVGTRPLESNVINIWYLLNFLE
jgi:hypothetical protein